MKHVWDYKIKRSWKPTTKEGWIWYLERRVNYDDWKGLPVMELRKYFRALKIGQGKKIMIEEFFKRYAKTISGSK